MVASILTKQIKLTAKEGLWKNYTSIIKMILMKGLERHDQITKCHHGFAKDDLVVTADLVYINIFTLGLVNFFDYMKDDTLRLSKTLYM